MTLNNDFNSTGSQSTPSRTQLLQQGGFNASASNTAEACCPRWSEEHMGLGMGCTDEAGIQALYCQRLPSEFTCLIASKGECPETCSVNALRPQRPALCGAYVCSSEALMIKTEDTHPEVWLVEMIGFGDWCMCIFTSWYVVLHNANFFLMDKTL